MAQSTQRVPSHVAVIMDGNGRWAERRGMPRLLGHRAGAEVVRRIVERAAESGVGLLTLYAFSSDNWKRPSTEVIGLMRLFEAHLRVEGRRLAAEGIRLEVIGRRDRLPARVLKAVLRAESLTAQGTRMTLRLAIDYSGRESIGRGTVGPDVDLLLRTGGERRLSDFLLWECAYAELIFTDTFWPDLSVAEFDAVLREYATRERRFGAVPARVSA
ncbi:MAG TPA: polyprenyl diphosphate synthase [Gemmatimonadales bacterium]|nr:polyprenyl diphosphate synthase [Gemmatimonadales bacterium]